MHLGYKCSQSCTPALAIINHPRLRRSKRQAGKGRVSTAPSGAAGSSADWFPGVAAHSLTTLPWEALWRWPVLHALPFPSGRSLGPGNERLCLFLGAAGLHVRWGLCRGVSAWLYLGLHPSTMQHKAFWSALEYTCRLLGISTAAGKSQFSLSWALKGTEWVPGAPGCLPAFGQLQPWPHPLRGTRKLARFCFGTQGGRVLGAWPGSFQMLWEAQ